MNSRKLIYAFTLLTVLSCESILDTKPQDGAQTADKFFTNKENFESYLFGAYAQLCGYADNNGIANVIMLNGFMTQDVLKQGRVRPYADFVTKAGDPGGSSNRAYAMWSDFYELITRANTVIDALPNGTEVSSSDKALIEAEAKMLRGFGYSYLAMAFGNVPMPLTQLENSQFSMSSSTEEQVWQQVVKDISEAVTILPTTWDNANLGRFNKGAAYAYLVNAYMYQQDWAKAETAANSLIALNQYSLKTGAGNLQDVFSANNPNNSATIFEVQYRAQDFSAWNGDPEPGSILPQWTGPYLSASSGGWGEGSLSKVFTDSHEAGDKRRTEMIKVLGDSFQQLFWPTPVVLTSDKFLYSEELTLGFSTKYWYNKESSNGSGFLGRQNIPMMRFAEFKLNYAEVLFRLGRQAEAYAQLNEVRANAGLGPKATSSSEDVFLNDLMNERNWELILEPNLWFHFVRTDRADDYLLARHNVLLDSKYYKYPIPQQEIDLNPNLSQNPGY